MAKGNGRAARHREQVTIVLGHSSEGIERRKAIEAAAERAGMTISSWCKKVLVEQAGLADDASVRRSELDALEGRVRALEGSGRA